MPEANFATGMQSDTFIDPTWAPGVMSGWLEDGVHNDNVECKRLDDEIVQPVTVCKSYILLPSLITHEPCPATINLSTASPCVDNCQFFVHWNIGRQLLISFASTYIFIHKFHRAVKEMYKFCFQNDLSQAWAYLWNWWYNPKQWPLWARSTDSAIYVRNLIDLDLTSLPILCSTTFCLAFEGHWTMLWIYGGSEGLSSWLLGRWTFVQIGST